MFFPHGKTLTLITVNQSLQVHVPFSVLTSTFYFLVESPNPRPSTKSTTPRTTVKVPKTLICVGGGTASVLSLSLPPWRRTARGDY